LTNSKLINSAAISGCPTVNLENDLKAQGRTFEDEGTTEEKAAEAQICLSRDPDPLEMLLDSVWARIHVTVFGPVIDDFARTLSTFLGGFSSSIGVDNERKLVRCHERQEAPPLQLTIKAIITTTFGTRVSSLSWSHVLR